MNAPLSAREATPVVIIGGLQRCSLIDYPGRTCAVIFTRGCDFRCAYCHNPELVLPERFVASLPYDEVERFLERRRGKLDAVTVSGGEPTLHSGLSDMLRRIRGMGYLVKLDTNGSRPEPLARILETGLADYIAMDIKAPLGKYGPVAGCRTGTEAIEKSVALIMGSGIDYEFRTTVARELASKDDLREIASGLIRGARRYYLQKFIASETLSPDLASGSSYPDSELENLADELTEYVAVCRVR